MKVAVLCAMLPKDLQEKVSDKCAVIRDKAKEQEAALIFTRVREEVKNVVKSRRYMRYMIIPKPMDIDTFKKDHWTDEYAYDHDQNHDTEEDDSVCLVGRDNKGKGKGACFSCGMFGHRAAECPNKGAGEGDKGKGKGWQPLAKPTRAFFGCGSTSHFSRYCPSKTANMCEKLRLTRNLRCFHRAHRGHHVRGRRS